MAKCTECSFNLISARRLQNTPSQDFEQGVLGSLKVVSVKLPSLDSATSCSYAIFLYTIFLFKILCWASASRNLTSKYTFCRHLIPDTFHVTPYMWHVKPRGWLTFSQNCRSLAFTVWEWRSFKDNVTKDPWLTHLNNDKDVCRWAGSV